jgi:hypothetical protein
MAGREDVVTSRVLVHLVDRLDTSTADVLTNWDHETLLAQFQDGHTFFSIFTHPCGLEQEDPQSRLRSICLAVKNAAALAGKPYEIVLRDESALNSLLRDPADIARNEDAAKRGSQTNTTHPMECQRLGSSGLKVSRLILGCMTFGNPDWEGSPWVMPERDALPLLKKAYDLGINTWETANTYSNGWSESIIGKALTEYNIPRSKVVIMTKLYYPVLEDDPTPGYSPL